MTTTCKTTWKVVGQEGHPIAGRDGEILRGIMLRCLEDGTEFIVTVSGIGTTPGANFANALRAAADHIEHSLGLTANPNEVH